MKYYIFRRSIKNGEIVDMIPGDANIEIFSFKDSDQLLASVDGVLPEQNEVLDHEEISFEQFAAQVNSSEQKLRNKDIARDRIGREVGDVYDLLADISKRQALNERLLLRLAVDLLPTLPDTSYVKQAYSGMIEQYVNGVDADVIVDRIDYEDIAEVFQLLIQRTVKIGEIVNEEYLSKKVK